jgi:hypothetical protein
MNNFEKPEIIIQTKEWEKAEILDGLNKNIFQITWFENKDYSFIKNSPEEVSDLCEKYNYWENFLQICKQELLDLA